MPSIGLTYQNTDWLNFSLPPTHQAQGRVQPRIRFVFDAKPPAGVEVEIMWLRANLMIESERLATGAVNEGVQTISEYGSQVAFEIPLSREAQWFAEQRFRAHTLGFQLEVFGTLRIKDTPDFQANRPYLQGITPREWHFIPVKGTFLVSIPRSEWVKTILEPLGFGEYILMELLVPPVPERQRWEKALAHLKSAEEQFLFGDDADVFSRCRAAFEAVAKTPSDFERLFGSIPDEEKRKKVDALLKEANTFFQAGRHVSQSGPQKGEFPVDHRDAEFALDLAKMFLAYLARLLAQAAP